MKKNIIPLAFLMVFQSFSQTLGDYLTIALSHNPLLESRQYLVRSAAENIKASGNVPNTQIGFGAFVSPVETRVGAQQFKTSLVQKFPWFGTLKMQKQAAIFGMQAKENLYKLTKQEIVLQVKLKYHTLCNLLKKIDILEQNKRLLAIFKTLALEQVKTHQSTMVDVLKIDIRQNEIDNQIKTIQNEVFAEKISFNLLLGVDKNQPVKVVEDYLENIKFLPQNANNLKNHLKLQVMAKEKESLSALEKVNKKMRLPQLSLGLDYAVVGQRNVENIADNGKDIVMPMLGVSIPLFSKKYSSHVKKLQWQQKSLQSKMDNTRAILQDQQQKTLKEMENMQNTIETLQRNIEKTEQTQKILLIAYTSSKKDFQQILEVQQWQLEFQLKKNDAQKQYANDSAILTYLNAN